MTPFTHLWLYRRIDGTYNDFLHEESVALLHCAVWFRKQVTGAFSGAADDDLLVEAESLAAMAMRLDAPEAEDDPA